MENVKIKHILNMVCINNHIELIDNHGYTSDLHFYGTYKKQLANLQKYSELYVIDIISKNDTLIINAQTEKYY